MKLQLFAQEKTEKATPRRRQKARERGQVFSSRELTSALILISSFMLIKTLGTKAVYDISTFVINMLQNLSSSEEVFNVNGLTKVFYESVFFIGRTVAPLALGVMSVGLLSNYLQVGFILNTEPLSPKLERINPLSGFKRVFSKRSVMELLKSIVKIFAVGYVVYKNLIAQKHVFPLMLDMDLTAAAIFTTNLAFNIGTKAAITLLVLSIFDLLYQWYEYESSLKMSKEDIKEEFKEVEGNPQTKSRIRQIQRQMSRGRMMKDLRTADVVITNPTHFAIGLAYDASTHSAPIVVAKGSDLLAQKIKEIAEEENIPIVEDKPLAQTLYKSVEVGDLIPEELYNAVAEILAFVYGLEEGRY